MIYVDEAFLNYGRMKMCHMTADTLDELFEVADLLKLKREWFQGPPDHRHAHFDISMGKRRAIALLLREHCKEARVETVSSRELAVRSRYLALEILAGRQVDMDSLPDDATYAMPPHGWTCFHCGQTFRNPAAARIHFGATPDAVPGCQMGPDEKLVAENRQLERRLRKLKSGVML